MSRDQQARSRLTILMGIINADPQKEVRLLLSSGWQGVIIHHWYPVDPFGDLLVLPCPVFMVN